MWDGRLARWIAERLGPKGSVVGIDPFEHRIRVARANAGTVRSEVGQAEDLGAFEDSSFDAVCLSSVLHCGLTEDVLIGGQLITNVEPGQPDTGLRFIEPSADDEPLRCPRCGAESRAQET